eukprot:COSAG04_NODE_4491_length_2057_cov_1.967314_1_plen_189_part_10
MDAVALAGRLQSSREYARSCAELPVEDVIAGCLESLETFGFCVIDHVIPEPELTAVVDEIVTVTPAIQDERRDYLQRSAEVRKKQAELHERGEAVTPEAVGYEPRRCEIHHLPIFAPYLASSCRGGGPPSILSYLQGARRQWPHGGPSVPRKPLLCPTSSPSWASAPAGSPPRSGRSGVAPETPRPSRG